MMKIEWQGLYAKVWFDGRDPSNQGWYAAQGGVPVMHPLHARAEVLRRAAEDGPIYAGAGNGQLFEEMMVARQDGLLREVEVVGVTYLEITDSGLDEYKALRREGNPK